MPPVPQKREEILIKNILDKLESIFKYICGVSMSIIVVVLFYAVVMRYVFHKPLGWSMELSRYIFLWMVMISAVLVTRERSHIQITFIMHRIPTKVRFVWINILRILMIGFCWIMIQQGLAIYPTVSEASSPALGISMGWLYLSIPIGGFLIAIYILEGIIQSVVYRAKTGSPKEELTC